MLRRLIVVGLCVAGLVVAPSGQQASPVLVLPNVTLIDGTGAAPRAAMTIVVRDGRITEIFPTGDRPVPDDARVLATDGRFVTPGFIDTHVHLATTSRPLALVEALLRATLLGGVTTVRDMGGNGAVVERMRAAAQTPGVVSPDIRPAAVFAGPEAFWFTDRARVAYLNDGRAPGSNPWLVRVEANTNIRQAVQRAKVWGAAGIKVHSHLTARQVRTITSEARRENLPVWSQAAVNPAGPDDVVDARVSTMSHADQLAWVGHAGAVTPSFGSVTGLADVMDRTPTDGPALADLLGRMRERRITLEPTLFVGVQAASFSPENRPQLDRQGAYAAQVTNQARRLGVMVVTGTDALGGSSPNLHVEMQLLVRRAGFTPLQAIRAATFDAAQAVGLGEETGSLTAGRRADLVVLVRNPAEDIRNTQTVLMVMRGGVVFERTDPMPVPPLAEAPGR